MTPESAHGSLELSTAEMRRLGYEVIDLIVDHYSAVASGPVRERADPPGRGREETLPKDGDLETLLEEVRERALSGIAHLDHPRFFAFVPSPGNFVSVMGDALASAFNVFAGNYRVAAGPAETELAVVEWLRVLCGLPEGAGGLFVTGGSAANMTALAVARAEKLGADWSAGTIYASDQTHSSIGRALRVLGFDDEALRAIPSRDFVLDPDDLRAAVERDRTGGRTPFCVVANAGTVNTGAVDPLSAIADVCRAENLWLHIDGAYGAAAIISPEAQALFEGISAADSISLDPHKWLFQPYEIGCVLVRDTPALFRTFTMEAEYIKDIGKGEEEVNFFNYGMQLTRGFRALKLWMSLKAFGLDAFAAAIGRGLELARVAEAEVERSPHLRVITLASLAIITFSVDVADDVRAGPLNLELIEELAAEGLALLSSTVVAGRTVARMCTINPRTSNEDIRNTIAWLDRAAGSLMERQENVERG